ncbi:MAG TPA: DUF1326 domain-containing protein [Candidatus Polarisedimenticolia bacterium]|jgi:hypothetical protein|nr:DUF1326 domain-containing protein [Candidatus Polarisedimenticolia bacterium]
MSRKAALFTVLILGAVGLTWLAVAAPAAEGTDKKPWKITGQLEEACSCSAACPCWFGSKPTKMTCGGGQFLFIQKGSYGGTSLDGLAIGNMVQSPEGKGMMDSFGKWNFSYLYIDEKASPEQRKALEAIGSTVLPLAASDKKETRVVPILRTVEGKEHKISLGQYGKFSGHLIEGGMGGSAKIVNPPGADPLHKEYEQGETTSLTYNDAGENWSFQGSNYMYGTFELDNVMYEKYVAGLAQKAAAKK